jgi:hypothetical protein
MAASIQQFYQASQNGNIHGSCPQDKGHVRAISHANQRGLGGNIRWRRPRQSESSVSKPQEESPTRWYQRESNCRRQSGEAFETDLTACIPCCKSARLKSQFCTKSALLNLFASLAQLDEDQSIAFNDLFLNLQKNHLLRKFMPTPYSSIQWLSFERG